MELNYLAVLGAGFAGMVIGSSWYMPQAFGTAWAKMVGVNLGEKEPKMAVRMIVAFLAQLVMAGFWLWLGLIATTVLSRVLWEKAPMKLYWINSLYVLVVMLVMSAILGVWAYDSEFVI